MLVLIEIFMLVLIEIIVNSFNKNHNGTSKELIFFMKNGTKFIIWNDNDTIFIT